MYLALPIIAAVLWGVCYAFMEQGLNSISVATITFLFGVGSILVSFCIPLFGGEAINFKPLLNKELFIILIVAVLSARIADVATTYAIQNVSATYAALGEISYPLFIPLIAFLAFGHNQLSAHTVIGGLIILTGVTILVYGQMNTSKSNSEKVALNSAGTSPDAIMEAPKKRE